MHANVLSSEGKALQGVIHCPPKALAYPYQTPRDTCSSLVVICQTVLHTLLWWTLWVDMCNTFAVCNTTRMLYIYKLQQLLSLCPPCQHVAADELQLAQIQDRSDI